MFSGVIHGVIPTVVKYGSYGFGWDPIFVPSDQSGVTFNGKSFAEITMEEKLSISQRGIALRALKEYLEKNN